MGFASIITYYLQCLNWSRTMKNDIDSKFVLIVFDKITKHGEKKGDEHFLMGIKGYTDFDGYTLFIEDAQVKLNFGFHNQYHFDYEKEEHFEKFIKKLKAIDEEY
ncbi:MAG: hypothetical protein ACI84K_002102 [Pseudohongiellaceae bacterium]|jgi:hypothetical protein